MEFPTMAGQEILPDKDLHLKELFSPPTYEDWRKVVENDLKGVPFEKKLVSKTYEGIDLQPIYTSAGSDGKKTDSSWPGMLPFRRGSRVTGYLCHPWLVCQDLPYGLAEEYNEALRHDLQRGMNCIFLPLDYPTQMGMDADYARPGEVGNNGVSISGLNSIARALKEVDLKRHPVFIEAGFSGMPFLILLKAFCEKNNFDFKSLSGGCISDPLGFLAGHGQLPADMKTVFDEVFFSTDWVSRNGSELRTIGVSGLPYHNAGASAVQELTAVMATAVEYIHQLTSRGLKTADLFRRIRLAFGTGSFYFMEIAKLRAARILWTKIAESFSVSPEETGVFIHSETSSYNQTVYDPYVNVLRTTTEAFSAVIGGADSICVQPFDAVFSLPDEFSRRLARNTQTILNEETHLRELIDPAGGSYFIESLTESVADAAWTLFQAIEKQGGMAQSLVSGAFQDEIRKTAEQRQTDYHRRKSVLVGTNLYTNPKEDMIRPRVPDYEQIYKKRREYLQKYRVSGNQASNAAVLQKLEQITNLHSEEIINLGIEAVLAGATLGEISKALRSQAGEPVRIMPVESRRASVLFEQLRKASENHLQTKGYRPSVFLATMGPLSQYKARADFSKGFFETGGFDVIYPSGFATPADAVSSAIESGSRVIVICSTDDTYPELVPPLVKEIKTKIKDAVVILAGYPKDQIEQHKQSGVDNFIYLGADVVQILSSVQFKTGVK